MATPPPSAPPKKAFPVSVATPPSELVPPPLTLPPTIRLPAVRVAEEQSNEHPIPKRVRTESVQQDQPNPSQLENAIPGIPTWQTFSSISKPITAPPPHHADVTVSSGQATPLTTTTNPNHHPSDPPRPSVDKPTPAPSLIRKEGRRIWNRHLLARNGASQTLLEALDNFSANAPIIPTHLDPSRKMYVRNMRGWIMHLALPVHDPLWQALIDVLHTDTSLTSVGLHWDQDLCRYILGKTVQDSQSKQPHHSLPKQSRQAVNNAIKRELNCPSESGNSSRGKTFRDLFREKCKAGGVKLPEIEQTTRSKRTADSGDRVPAPSEANSPSSAQVAHTQTRVTTVGGEESYVSLPLPNTSGKVPSHGLVDDSELSRLRSQCSETDEWNRIAWWRLTSDDDVKKIPLLLAHFHLHALYMLLIDFRWIARTFHCVDYSNGMRQVPTDGYDVMLEYAQRPGVERSPVDIEGFRLIRNAIMLILPILSKETSSNPTEATFIAHLATQLVGRLLDLKRRFPIIASLIQSIEEHAPRPWLRPLTRCFHQPRTDIKLAVPSNGNFTPHLIFLSEDGTLLATSGASTVEVKAESSQQSTVALHRPATLSVSVGRASQRARNRRVYSIVIWDVHSGKCVCKGPEIRSTVRLLSLSRDNSCIIAETVNGLFFWHMDKSEDMWTIRSHAEATPRIKLVSSITPAVGSSHVLTTHRLPQEPMIVLWDSNTGQKVDCFNRVTSIARCVDISARGDYFASGHDDGFIHVWAMKEKVPVLSFKNEGADRGQQQMVDLSDVKRTPPSGGPVISISFYEKGEERWLTAVSGNQKDVIRVWLLPPRHISHDQWKTFVSSRRIAVLKCPRIQQAQWSQNGNFFTGGEDGIARMWRRGENGKWEWYAIDKENGEGKSSLLTVLLSCGKRSQLVATYVTKSPYVTVWDMSKTGEERKSGKRRWLYRAYLPLIDTSVDARDIGHLATIELKRGPRQNENEGNVLDPKWMSPYGDNLGQLRTKLGRCFFVNQDTKSTTTLDGDVQPWLRMLVGGGASGMEGGEEKVLRVCFEQAVMTGISGVFKSDSGHKESGIGDIWEMDGSVKWEREGQGKRRGMVALLEDGTVGIFELEEAKERSKEVDAMREMKELSGRLMKNERAQMIVVHQQVGDEELCQEDREDIVELNDKKEATTNIMKS